MIENIDINSISFEDLHDEYQKLKERYSQLLIVNEEDTQRIHELRRSLETANAAEAYLVQELEQLSSVQTSQDDALLHKKQNEVDDLKKRQSLLLTENEELQQDIADLRAENDKLLHQIKELTLASYPAEITYRIPPEHLELREKLEIENLELLAKLDETHENVVKFTMSLAEKEKHIEILKDQVLCLEENLQSKREEIDEKSHLLESTQEQVVEMNAKIAMLTSCPNNDDRKGNSLFAEVDDQRQAMKQLLAAQKKNYLQMRKIYNESQHEIRRLKRENVAMHNELEACSTIFCSADKTYKEKLNERILQLLKQNEDLENKLILTEKELISLANDKGVAWLDSMLLFCKQETEELKKELRSNRIQKGLLEERLRKSQQDLAKWRFEALKTRCILIDREGLLTNNKIDFKIFTNKDVTFTTNELENAKPNIGLGNRVLKEKTISEDECVSVKVVESVANKASVIVIDDDVKTGEAVKTTPVSPQSMYVCSAPKLENCYVPTKEHEDQPKIASCEETNSIVKVECWQSPNCTPICKTEGAQIKIESNNLLDQQINNLPNKVEPNDDEDKENRFDSPLESGDMPKLCVKNIRENVNKNRSIELAGELRPSSSILVTDKRNILDNESNVKTVHFAPVAKFEQSEPKFMYKSVRTKSNVVVQRIILGHKREAGAPPRPQ